MLQEGPLTRWDAGDGTRYLHEGAATFLSPVIPWLTMDDSFFLSADFPPHGLPDFVLGELPPPHRSAADLFVPRRKGKLDQPVLSESLDREEKEGENGDKEHHHKLQRGWDGAELSNDMEQPPEPPRFKVKLRGQLITAIAPDASGMDGPLVQCFIHCIRYVFLKLHGSECDRVIKCWDCPNALIEVMQSLRLWLARHQCPWLKLEKPDLSKELHEELVSTGSIYHFSCEHAEHFFLESDAQRWLQESGNKATMKRIDKCRKQSARKKAKKSKE